MPEQRFSTRITHGDYRDPSSRLTISEPVLPMVGYLSDDPIALFGELVQNYNLLGFRYDGEYNQRFRIQLSGSQVQGLVLEQIPFSQSLTSDRTKLDQNLLERCRRTAPLTDEERRFMRQNIDIFYFGSESTHCYPEATKIVIGLVKALYPKEKITPESLRAEVEKRQESRDALHEEIRRMHPGIRHEQYFRPYM